MATGADRGIGCAGYLNVRLDRLINLIIPIRILRHEIRIVRAAGRQLASRALPADGRASDSFVCQSANRTPSAGEATPSTQAELENTVARLRDEQAYQEAVLDRLRLATREGGRVVGESDLAEFDRPVSYAVEPVGRPLEHVAGEARVLRRVVTLTETQMLVNTGQLVDVLM